MNKTQIWKAAVYQVTEGGLRRVSNHRRLEAALTHANKLQTKYRGKKWSHLFSKPATYIAKPLETVKG